MLQQFAWIQCAQMCLHVYLCPGVPTHVCVFEHVRLVVCSRMCTRVGHAHGSTVLVL